MHPVNRFLSLVFGDIPVFLSLFDVVIGLAAQIANSNLAFLAQLFDQLGQFLTALLAQRGTESRMTLPSLLGVMPKSLFRMAFSISPIMALSQG